MSAAASIARQAVNFSSELRDAPTHASVCFEMFTKMFATLIATFVFTVVLVIDPKFVIEHEPPPFQFTEANMRVATEGTWELTHERSTYRFSLSHGGQAMEQDMRAVEGMISAAEACSNDRSFVRPAAACIVATTLALVGEGRGDTPKQITGGLHIAGYRFHRGYLDLQIGGIRVGARITALGVVEAAHSSDLSPVTLKRIALRLVRTSGPAVRATSPQ